MKFSPLLALLCGTTVLQSAELDFFQDVYPFLKANCISCHNKTTAKAGLNMETPELMIKGGHSGPSLVPGKSEESLIVLASTHQEDMEMPPVNNKSGAENLSPEEIAVLKRWVNEGAKSSVQKERAVVLKKFTTAMDPIYSVAVTGDGRYAACGRSNKIYIYDLATRQLVGQVSDPAEKDGVAHRALVHSLAFSPDGTRLASGSFREVKVWKLDLMAAVVKGSEAEVLAKPAGAEVLKKITATGKVAVLTSALSGDGKQVVTGCPDGSVRVWDAATAKPVMELRGTVATVKKMAELDRVIATQALEQSFYKDELARYAAQDKALDVLLGKAKEAIVTMGKVLPEKKKAVLPVTEARAAAQKKVDELSAKFAKAKESAVEKELKKEQDNLISAKTAEMSALSAVSAAESNIQDAEDDVKRITDSKAANAKLVAAANAATASANVAKAKAAVDVAALKLAMTKATSKPVAVSFSADGQRVASLFEDGSVRVWAAASGTPIDESNAEASATVALAATADGSFVATKASSLRVGGPPRWTLEKRISPQGLFHDRVNAVTFSPDGKTLATGGGQLSRSGDITILDVATGKATKTWKEVHSDTVLCLDFSPDGKLLASGAADKMARVTDIASGRQVNLFEGHTHHVMSIAFRSDGRVLATAGAEGVVLTWNMIMGERKKKIDGWSKEVTSLEFIGATNQIVTSAGDNRIRIITDEGADVRSMANLPDFMQAVASSPNGSLIVGGGEDSQLRLWDAAGKEIAVFGKSTSVSGSR